MPYSTVRYRGIRVHRRGACNTKFLVCMYVTKFLVCMYVRQNSMIKNWISLEPLSSATWSVAIYPCMHKPKQAKYSKTCTRDSRSVFLSFCSSRPRVSAEPKKSSARRLSYLSPGATGWNMWQLRDMLTPGRYVLSAITIASVLTCRKFHDRGQGEVWVRSSTNIWLSIRVLPIKVRQRTNGDI